MPMAGWTDGPEGVGVLVKTTVGTDEDIWISEQMGDVDKEIDGNICACALLPKQINAASNSQCFMRPPY
jgi:hypothetical protein